jgi:lysophospholipase L1-like esterase
MPQTIRGNLHVNKRLTTGLALNLPTWQPTKDYLVGDKFRFGTDEFNVKTDHTSPAAFDSNAVEIVKVGGLRTPTVPTIAELKAQTAASNQVTRVSESGIDYIFNLGSLSGDHADDASTGFWREIYIESVDIGINKLKARNVSEFLVINGANNYYQPRPNGTATGIIAPSNGTSVAGASIVFDSLTGTFAIVCPPGGREFIHRRLDNFKIQSGKDYILTFKITNLVQSGGARAPKFVWFGPSVSSVTEFDFLSDGDYAVPLNIPLTFIPTDTFFRIGIGADGTTANGGSMDISELCIQELVDDKFYDFIERSEAVDVYPGNTVGVDHKIIPAVGLPLEGTLARHNSLIVIGDSISDELSDFPSYIANHLDMPVIAESLGGRTLVDSVTAATQLLALPEVSGFSSVLIHAGINDLLGSETLANMIAAWESIETLVLTAGKNVIGSKLPLSLLIENNPALKLIAENYNKFVKTTCSSKGYTYVELQTQLVDPAFNYRLDQKFIDGTYTGPTAVVGDDLHPKPDGQRLMATHLFEQLKHDQGSKTVRVGDLDPTQFTVNAAGQIEINKLNDYLTASNLVPGLRLSNVADLTILKDLIPQNNSVIWVVSENKDYVYSAGATTGDEKANNASGYFNAQSDNVAPYTAAFAAADFVGGIFTVAPAAHRLGLGFRHVTVYDSANKIVAVETSVDPLSGDVTLGNAVFTAFDGSIFIS